MPAGEGASGSFIFGNFFLAKGWSWLGGAAALNVDVGFVGLVFFSYIMYIYIFWNAVSALGRVGLSPLLRYIRYMKYVGSFFLECA